MDIRIRLADVPPLEGELSYTGLLLTAARDGRCRLTIPGVATYGIAPKGDGVTIAPEPGIEETAVRAFLLGTVFAILCLRRGLLPLHACCVGLPAADGPVAVAITAPSGTGKSTLAAAFREQGFAILADDLTVVAPIGAGRALALPTFPRVRLWADMLRWFPADPDAMERVRAGMEKFAIPLAAGFATDPLPLSAIYHLTRVEHERHAGLERLKGLAASSRLVTGVYRHQILARVAGTPATLLGMTTETAARIPSHWEIAQPPGLDRLQALVARMAADHRGDAVR